MAQATKHFIEISNLRAFAVVVVLLYHFWPAAAPGGFVGVDVFFIVSGYVVSAAYFERVAAREIAVRDFLWRRVRRLMPAAVTVVIVTWLIGCWRLEPNELLLLSQSILSQVFYAQNFFFLLGGDYFHGALDKPLLHTWSLAVEEQFYLLFPVLAFVAARFRRRLLVIGALLVLSLVGAFVVAQVSPKIAFFMLPTRAWEILLGVWCWALNRRVEGAARPWVSASSVVLLFISAFAFDERAVFPDLHSLIAAVGTAGVLLSVRVDGGARSRAALEWLSERSYSLYLWHWPLYVYAVRDHGTSPGRVVLVAVATIVVTEACFRLIEDPIRRGRRLVSKNALAGFAVASVAVMAVASSSALFADGFPSRYPAPADQLFGQAVEQNHGRCGIVARVTHPDGTACNVGGTGSRGLLVIGDSHADAMDEQLASLGAARGFRVYLADTSCDAWSLVGRVFRCGETYRAKLIAFAQQHDIDRVVLISSWASFKGDRLKEAVTALRTAGLRVTISGPLPGGDDFDPAVQARRVLVDANYEVPIRVALDPRNDAEVTSLLRAMRATDPTLTIAWPQPLLCDAATCAFSTDGAANFYDGGHLTTVGAKRVLPAYDVVFAD